MVVLVPVLMIVLLVLIQFALWAHAAQISQLAASEGNRVSRTLGGTPAEGVGQAQSVLEGSGSDLGASQTTVGMEGGDEVRTTVTGNAVSLLPGLTFPVIAVVTGPLQEFRGSE
jgi:Flp pilus assembly protein TadG